VAELQEVNSFAYIIAKSAVEFLAFKRWGLFWGQHKCGGETQRLKMYVRNSFTVVILHNLWRNYPRSIWHVMGLVCEKWRQPWGKAKLRGHGPMT